MKRDDTLYICQLYPIIRLLSQKHLTTPNRCLEGLNMTKSVLYL